MGSDDARFDEFGPVVLCWHIVADAVAPEDADFAEYRYRIFDDWVEVGAAVGTARGTSRGSASIRWFTISRALALSGTKCRCTIRLDVTLPAVVVRCR